MVTARRHGITYGILASFAVFAASALHAAHGEAFIGGSIGQSHWSDTPCDSRVCDKHETAGTLRAGYNFSPYFGVEARYFDLGSINARNPDIVPPPGSQVLVISDKVSARGAGVNAIATWPVTERISISGIAGLAWTEAKSRSEAHLEPPGETTIISGTFESTRRSTRPYYGVSVGYSFTPAWMLSLEAERYRPDFGGGTVPVDLYAVGVTYRFR